jgi:hypothetical protein
VEQTAARKEAEAATKLLQDELKGKISSYTNHQSDYECRWARLKAQQDDFETQKTH